MDPINEQSEEQNGDGRDVAAAAAMSKGRDAATVLPLPAGMITRDEAARMFGVAENTWQTWVVQKKVPAGVWHPLPWGGRTKIYSLVEIQRMLAELRGPGKAYWDPQNPGYYRIPEGFVGRRDAWRMFGVDKQTWKRWEREGRIACGKRVHRGGPKLYKLEDLQRLLDEYGRYSPPYPDPDRLGCYRVPLSGWDIRRREAIIDAESLPLVEGKRWCWSPPNKHGGIGEVALSKSGQTTPLRRIIMGVSDPRLRVTNANRDPLDCRRENLIVRTYNQQARGMQKIKAVNGRPCTSRFKGVSWSRSKGKWTVQIKRGEKNRLVGRFDDEIAAAQAYDEAAREAFGEHAWLNFPNGIDASLLDAQPSPPPDLPPRDPLPCPQGMIDRIGIAERFGMSPLTLYEWQKQGRLRGGKIVGQRTLYPIEEVDRLEEEIRQLEEPRHDPQRPGCWLVPVWGMYGIRCEAVVDEESLPLIKGKRWNWSEVPNDRKVVLATASGEQTPMRRIIAQVQGSDARVAHVNGDPLDCRRANLVVRNVQQQCWHARKMGTVSGRVCTSRYKGVFWNSQKQKWNACIHPNGRRKHLGFFTSEIAAAEAYDRAALQYFGEHALINFPADGSAGGAAPEPNTGQHSPLDRAA